MTVTRASLRRMMVASGMAGARGGQDAGHNDRLVDALMQGDHANQLEAAVLAPLREAREPSRCAGGEAAATKVDFSPWHEVRTDEQHRSRGCFTNAATESAAIFRATLNAMARPGVIETVVGAGSGILPPKPLSAAAGAVLLTLADHETPASCRGS